MENLDLEWVEALRSQLKNHICYTPLANHRAALEPGFRELLDSLPLREREIIEEYLLAVQKLDVQLTYLAFQAGKNAKQTSDLNCIHRK